MKIPFAGNRHLVMAVSWRKAVRLPSMWLGLVASSISGWIVANPAFFVGLIAYMPSTERPLYAVLLAVFVLLLVGSTRLIAMVRENDERHPDNQ